MLRMGEVIARVKADPFLSESAEDQVRSPRGGAGGLFTRRARASGSSRPDAAVALARNTHRHNPPGRAAE